MKIFSADYVLPISDDLIEDGAVAVEKDKIAAVGKRKNLLGEFPQAVCENFGASVIMPSLINVHSHLEITAMRGFLDDVEEDFYSWLIKLTKTRAEKLTEKDIEISALAGAIEGLRAGVTCFGDIGRYGKAGFEALKKTGLRGIVFQETEFSPQNETAAADFAKLKEKFSELRENETKSVKAGLSPHAPYTVSKSLFEKITDYALAENVKISIHAAESIEEAELMKTGTGIFAEIFQNLGFEWDAPHTTSIEYLAQIGVLQAKPLLAHCVTVTENDIRLLAESDSSVAHCPKSNAKFGHGFAPLEIFFGENLRVGFGSDSVASNNSCDIFEEARFSALFARNTKNKKHFPGANKIIETATLGAARALGLEREVGSLEVGKQADLIVVSLENVAQMPIHDVYSALLFASNSRDVRMTIAAGREIYRDGIVSGIDESEIRAKLKEIGNRMRH